MERVRNGELTSTFKKYKHLPPTEQHPIGGSLLVTLLIEDQSFMDRHMVSETLLFSEAHVAIGHAGKPAPGSRKVTIATRLTSDQRGDMQTRRQMRYRSSFDKHSLIFENLRSVELCQPSIFADVLLAFRMIIYSRKLEVGR